MDRPKSDRYFWSTFNWLLEKQRLSPLCYDEMKKIDFEYSSYAKSAMKEIMDYVLKNKDEDPILLVENFRHDMDCIACSSKTGIKNFMFSVYYDIATEVLDNLMSKKYDY